MTIPLVIATETGQYERMLRRFVWRLEPTTCTSPEGYHQASTILGRVGEAEKQMVHGDTWPHDDARWPAQCSCGYAFTEGDQWQLNDNRIFRLPNGTEFVSWGSFGHCAPPGTMIRAHWYDEFVRKQFALGELTESWVIALPDGGEWLTTQRASGGEYWTVTGTPPNITAHPSIWHNSPHGWHGWVKNGALVNA